MGDAAKKISTGNKSRGEGPIDVASARLVRIGPRRPPHLALRTMREAVGLTQAQVSKRSGIAQPEISKLEAAGSLDDRQVSTVRRYLAAIDTELDLVAVSKFGHRIGIADDSHTTAKKVPDVESPRVEVPTVDGSGAPLPAWRVARWHLLNAANLLRGEYLRVRGEKSASEFEAASIIAEQLWTSLDPKAPRSDCLRRMAREVNDQAVDGRGLQRLSPGHVHRMKTSKADAERFLLEKLPKSGAEAREQYIAPLQRGGVPEAEQTGAENLARLALAVVAGQDHADAGKVLQRWGATPDPRAYLQSARYQEDLAELAGVVAELLDEERVTFAHDLVRRMYHLLDLGRPFETLRKTRKRKARAARA